MSKPTLSILVVDDDEDIRETLSLVLGWHGYRVVLAIDGLDALEQLRAGPRPALVLLDARMPRLSGKELAERLHAEGLSENLPIVVLSGDSGALDDMADLGTAGMLKKPVDLDALLGIVDELARSD